MKQNRNIFIIAGHRGGNTGAVVDDKSEALETIRVREWISEGLKAKGIIAINDNDNASLNNVVAKVNKMCTDRDICVDIHFNSFSNPSAQGTEVLIPTSYSNLELELAEDTLNVICKTLGTKNRGVKREGSSQYKRLAMLSGIKCNSILIEICFLSNISDMFKYEKNLEEMIKGLVDLFYKYVTQ